MNEILKKLPVFHPGDCVIAAMVFGNPTIKQWLMRINVLIILMTTILLSTLAEESSAQRITLQGNKLSLKEALSSIRTQTGYDVLMGFDARSFRHAISIQVKNQPLPDVLKQLLSETDINFEINHEKKAIILKLKSPNPVDPKFHKKIKTTCTNFTNLGKTKKSCHF